MIRQYNITDYIKDDPELQKAVIEEFLNDIKRLQAENEELRKSLSDSLLFKFQSQDNELEKYKKALEKIREILCKGRTFYDGYFENENLSRTDEAIKVINEVLK